jgi:hypothetical protein
MTKYKNELAVGLVFPTLGLEIEPGATFESEEDLTGLSGIVVVDDKKTAKAPASTIEPDSSEE